MNKYLAIAYVLILASTQLYAQPYLNNKSKYRFAQGAMGIDLMYVPNNGQGCIIDTNGVNKYNFGGYYVPRIVIGGTHFWGHADFAINFPVGKFGGKKDSLASNNEFDIVSAKYYPWAIRKNKIRPFIGTSCNVNLFKQAGTGIYNQYWGGTDFKLSLPINFGASYQLGSLLLSADAKLNINNNREIYANRTQTTTYRTPSFGISFGVKKIFEGTVKQFEKKYEDGTLAKEYTRNKNKLNAFSFGIGLSSSFYTQQSQYQKQNTPYMSKHANATFIPELALGYYLDKQDVHFNIAYRNINTAIGGFGMIQDYNRKSITVEAFKFLWDYKGFVPFAGVGISHESIGFAETDRIKNASKNYESKQFSPSIIAGWDIRYHRNYWFMLRTNIRYYPFLQLDTKTADGKINFNQLEVNFIQAVFYPKRLVQKIKDQKSL